MSYNSKLQSEEYSDVSQKSSTQEEDIKNVNELPDKQNERYTPIFEPKVSKIYPDESSASEEISSPHYKGSYFQTI